MIKLYKIITGKYDLIVVYGCIYILMQCMILLQSE